MKAITITKEDYFNHSGINLEIDFKHGETDDGVSGVQRFLNNISEEVWDYLQARYIFDVKKFETLTQNDKNIVKRYKKALCHQVDFIRKSGDARSNIELREIGITADLSPKAYDIFKMLGLTNIQFAHDIYRRY